MSGSIPKREELTEGRIGGREPGETPEFVVGLWVFGPSWTKLAWLYEITGKVERHRASSRPVRPPYWWLVGSIVGFLPAAVAAGLLWPSWASYALLVATPVSAVPAHAVLFWRLMVFVGREEERAGYASPLRPPRLLAVLLVFPFLLLLAVLEATALLDPGLLFGPLGRVVFASAMVLFVSFFFTDTYVLYRVQRGLDRFVDDEQRSSDGTARTVDGTPAGGVSSEGTAFTVVDAGPAESGDQGGSHR